jgi:Predicted hydrolase (HAD superfamily)
MQKKAIIFDLDNTIYLVSSIGERLFETLFRLIADSGECTGSFDMLKGEIMRRPYQYVAEEFGFSDKLKHECFEHLKNLTYDLPIKPVENYDTTRSIPCTKFLVTTGFTNLQNSKIDRLEIRNDFEKIFIIDPFETAKTKRDVFKELLIKYAYKLDEVLVVGDDLNSEIKAAKELGIESVLYDFRSIYSSDEKQAVIRNLSELQQFI